MLFKKKTEQKTPQKNSLEADLKTQDKLYAELNKVYSNETPEQKIKRYEAIMTPQNIPLIQSRRLLLELPEMYINAGQNDKAWAFYNLLYEKGSVDKKAIRDLQAKMLKKEKNHVEAIKFFMMKRAEEYAWKKSFDREGFIKDISISVRALKWTADIQEHIADIAAKYITKQTEMLKEYSKYIKSLGA